MRDIEVVTLVLTAAYLRIDSEYELFRNSQNLCTLRLKGVFTTKENADCYEIS